MIITAKLRQKHDRTFSIPDKKDVFIANSVKLDNFV